MQTLPLTLDDYLKALARQTARMSYPGSMSRGKSPVVRAGTKALIEEWFCDNLVTNELWGRPKAVAARYRVWHEEKARALGRHLFAANRLGSSNAPRRPEERNEPTTVAAKFIDTFMHQLMKQEKLRPLQENLHLPLDRRVLNNLAGRKCGAAARIKKLVGKRRPYTLPYEDYAEIQNELWGLLKEFNDDRPAVHLKSRIDLNFLWL